MFNKYLATQLATQIDVTGKATSDGEPTQGFVDVSMPYPELLASSSSPTLA